MSRCQTTGSFAHRPGWTIVGPALLTVLLAVGALAGSACDASHPVMYENRTHGTIMILQNGVVDFTLGPFETRTFELFEFRGSITFEARDESGRVIYSEALTREEIKRRGWKILITEAAPTGGSPTSAATSAAALGSAADPQNVQNVITYLPRGIAQLRTCR